MPVSKQLTQIYNERLKGSTVKCIYIPNCLQYYPNIVSNLKQPRVLSAGRFSPEKGFLDLIDVFEIVSKKNPGWCLTIAGDGQEREKIENKIKEKKLQDKIQLLGFQKEKELNELMLQSSIYVMTSFHESFGLVLIEAESYGLPILAFDSAEGPKEIIQNGKNGFLIENRNKEEMADKINELMINEELRQTIGEKAREESQQYKVEQVEKMWYELIEKDCFNKF